MGEALRKRRWLLSSTVESHDGLMLELPGLGNSQSIEALCNLVQRWNLEVIFLTETKMNIVGMKKVKLVVESNSVVAFEAINANNCNGDIGPVI